MAGINFQPFRTQGSFKNGFNVESRGLVQGDAQADPAVRLQLCTGWLPNDLDGAVYGGLPIVENISTPEMNVAGCTIRPATSRADGICVFNQAYHGIITAGNNVPQYMAGGTIHYYRFGSLARIPLPISEAVRNLATSGTNDTTQNFVWDPTNMVVDLAANFVANADKADEIQRTQEENAGFISKSQEEALKKGVEEAEKAQALEETGGSGSGTSNTINLPIKLIYISEKNNMSIIDEKKDGFLSWSYSNAVGLFLI